MKHRNRNGRQGAVALLAVLTLLLGLLAGCGEQTNTVQQPDVPAVSGDKEPSPAQPGSDPEEEPEGAEPEDTKTGDDAPEDAGPGDTETAAPADPDPDTDTGEPASPPPADPEPEEAEPVNTPPEEPEPAAPEEPEPNEAVPEDGTYTAAVTLEGGTGRASVESPAKLRCENGQFWATIVWSSSNYDYMKVDGVRYDLISTEGNSTFEIPVAAFDQKLDVIADTVAMSTPHEVEYTLFFDSSTLTKE